MKVLQFICSTGFYGAERWILALAKHLPAEVQSELVVTLEPGTEDLELVRHFKEIGPTHQLPMKSRFDLSVINKLADLMKTHKIDVLHTHGYKSDIIGVLAARKAGVTCVVTPHGFENADDIKLRMFIWAGCQAMRYADHVAPLSQQLMGDARRFKVKEEKLTYIQNGVDLSEVEAVRLTKQPKKSDDIKTIGFVGQMISRKNIKDILDTFDTLYSCRQDVQLLLLGDGEDRPQLEVYAKTLKSSNAISFLGFRQDRLQLLRDFDLFVMTSTLEGIPRCLMEACAMAIPVSAYKIPGIDQLITHNETGLLATLHDKPQILKDWETLLDDSERANTLASNAKEYVETHYSAQRMANEYHSLFTRLLNERTHG